MSEDNTEFMSRLLSSFKVEAADHLISLSHGLLALEKDLPPSELGETIQKIFRAAHSLKGAARAVNLLEIEGVCQALEDVLSHLRDGKLPISKELINTLLECVDAIESFLNAEKQDDQNFTIESSTALISRLEVFLEPTAKLNKQPKKEVDQTPKTTKPEVEHSIRISVKKIDRLLQHVEEMLMIKLSSDQKIKELKKLHDLLSLSDKESLLHFSEKQMQRSKDTLKALNRLINLCEQDHRVICGMVDGVIDDTKEILMQPFLSLLEPFSRMVRDLALSVNKEVTLDIDGGDIEVDRRILEQLRDPFIHALRNSIDHGIESPEERENAGKPRQGKIKIFAKQISGSSFHVTISDDGHGIDFAKVKEKAFQKGLISEEKRAHMSDDETCKLLFQPGFTTSDIVTDLSGRGVGLNVLVENIERLGGGIQIDSTLGLGTSIIITMPLTLATFRGIHVTVSNQDYILPTTHVQRVLRISSSKIKTVENKETVTIGDRTYSYVYMGRLFGLSSPDPEEETSQKSIVLLKASEVYIAFGVDAINAEQEVFVKSLGKQLQRVKCISAATIMEWGKVIPILDPFDLVKAATENQTMQTSFSRHEDQSTPESKSILVVEDSITSRVLLKNILEREGYQVRSAVDGVEGLNILKHENVDLLVSDVEMPRMDGFELTKTVRGTESTAELPIILCTSRGSKEDREHGIAAGANAYLDKSNFKQTGLLEIIAQLI